MVVNTYTCVYGPVSGGTPLRSETVMVPICIYIYIYTYVSSIYTYIYNMCVYLCSMCMCKFIQYVYVCDMHMSMHPTPLWMWWAWGGVGVTPRTILRGGRENEIYIYIAGIVLEASLTFSLAAWRNVTCSSASQYLHISP